MARKCYKPQEIVGELRLTAVRHGQGMAMAELAGPATPTQRGHVLLVAQGVGRDER